MSAADTSMKAINQTSDILQYKMKIYFNIVYCTQTICEGHGRGGGGGGGDEVTQCNHPNVRTKNTDMGEYCPKQVLSNVFPMELLLDTVQICVYLLHESECDMAKYFGLRVNLGWNIYM